MFPTALFSRPSIPAGAGGICVDVVGQPAVNLVDFTGLTGANFVTASEGLYFFLYGNSGNQKYAFWFNTGTETAPDTGVVSGIEEVDISPIGDAPSIAVALINLINAGGFPYWTAVQGGGFGGTGAVITASANLNLTPAADVNTGAAFSQTQPGYPSGHYCTPTSDALAGISFAFRGQCTYLGVTNNAGGLGQPGYTTQDLNGNQLLFQDSAMTIPAVNQGDTVMAWKDPITGIAAIQSNSLNAFTLTFYKNSLGIYTPTLVGNNSSSFLKTSTFSTGTACTCIIGGARPWTNISNYCSFVCKGSSDSPSAGFKIAQAGYTTQDWVAGDWICFANGYGSGNPPRAIGPLSGLVDGQFATISCDLSSAETNSWLDGSLLSTRVSIAGASSGDSNAMTIGINFDDSSQPWDGPISAVLYSDSLLSDADRATAQNYVASLLP